MSRHLDFRSSSLSKDRSKDEILSAFKTRIANNRQTEFNTACREVEKIALLRLQDMLPN